MFNSGPDFLPIVRVLICRVFWDRAPCGKVTEPHFVAMDYLDKNISVFYYILYKTIPVSEDNIRWQKKPKPGIPRKKTTHTRAGYRVRNTDTYIQ